MNPEPAYNPLDKKNLGVSVTDALLARPVVALPPERFTGAGIYAIYYTGDFLEYASVRERNTGDKFSWPIYVGKAVPQGARKGIVDDAVPIGSVLHKRLCEHAKSIQEARNLNAKDFNCRYLIVDDIWIPLGESLLIQRFRPIWNVALEGFGLHDPGKGRHAGQRSPWDEVHPGRPFAARLAPNKKSRERIIGEIRSFLRDISGQ